MLESRQQGKTIYQDIMVMSVLVSAFVFPFVGKLCDSYSPKLMIPLAFLLRAFTTLMFYLVATPNSK